MRLSRHGVIVTQIAPYNRSVTHTHINADFTKSECSHKWGRWGKWREVAPKNFNRKRFCLLCGTGELHLRATLPNGWVNEIKPAYEFGTYETAIDA